MALSLNLSRRNAMLGASLVVLGACASKASSETSPRADLYNCDGCEESFIDAPANLDWQSRIVSEGEPGERLVAEGRVFQPDGVTPAAGVVIFAHQTNAAGLYETDEPSATPAERERMIRGWIKTDALGRYRFETVKPGPYPTLTMPAHIHFYIAEPGRRTYYIDDIVFAGEFGVDADYRAAQELRGGSGITALAASDDGTLLGHRDIVLERHP